MSFFNDDFYKELDKNYESDDDEVEETDDYYDDDDYYDNVELDVNKRNQEKFKDVMDNAAISYDAYWDLNNPAVVFILVVLFIIIVVGILYYIIGWINLL